jgi:secreted trypsin-like serine protease
MRCVLLVTLAACTPPLSTSEHDIIGGTSSSGAAATVMLAGYPPSRSVIHTCTAVLVAPTVLLTSAHCIDTPNHPNYLYGVYPDADASAYPQLVDLEPHLVAVTSVHPHPQYSTQLPFFADIGVVILSTALPTAPLPMRRTPLDPSIAGKPATIMGYGQTTYQQFNQKRFEATTTVVGIENDTVIVGDSQKHGCLGDSGGPAIVDGTLIGIDSYGPTGCTGPAHYRRVDSFLPFIDTYAPPTGSAPDAGVGTGPDAGTDEPTDGGGCSAGTGLGLGLVFALAGLRRRRRV